MRILQFTPLHPSYGIRKQSLDSIMSLSWQQPLHRLFMSGDNPFGQRWQKWRFQNVLHQHKQARAAFLAGDYDALLSIEADMVVPSDTIERMSAVDADIVYGLYVWRVGHHWSAYSQVEAFGGMSFSKEPERAKAAWETVQDVAGVGMGCTLIYRHVLENLRFELFDLNEGVVCDDWVFAWCAQLAEYRQACDFGLVCGHMLDAETAVYPDPTQKELYRYDKLV